ncbi:MAG: ABC transporter ATP-binding protein [Planctomycetes bacterium]|nr:ABC transporter ATP-binding protein [Planctomycetota bacterium]
MIRPHQRFVWFGLALLLVGAACRLTMPYLVKLVVDDHLVPGKLDGVGTLVATFLGVAVLDVLGRRGQMVALETAGQNALLDLRLRVFRHLQRLPTAFFDRTPIGRLVGRVTTDIEALQEMFSSGLVTILGDVVFLIAAVVLLLGLSAQLTGATMLMVPVLVVTTMFVRVRVRRAYLAMRERLSQLNGFLHEQVSGMPTVQLFGREQDRVAQLATINGAVRDAQLGTVRWESVLSAVTEMLGFYTTALILWYGGGLATGGEVQLGTLLAFVQYMGLFFTPLNELSQKYTVMQNAMVASERIFALLDETPEPDDPATPERPSGHGRIEFRGVQFAYGPGTPVLHDLSFTIEPGERVALVGATGAGKTTVLSLLTRLYDPQAGGIYLDGVRIDRMARTELRRRIGVVPQDVVLFRGTVLDNLRLGQPDATDAQAIAAARRLGLDDLVSRMPGGFAATVAERGGNLSAGEKQLLALARMLVVEPPVLALDEATSNVDARTEQLLQNAVHELMLGRTSLVIAHRLSTVRDADRILVLEHGRLVEQGTHAALLARRGLYWRLHQLQFADEGS